LGDDRGCRGHQSYGFQESDQVARPHHEVTSAATGIAQALESLEVLPIGSECDHIEFLEGYTRTVSPVREAMGPSQEVLDTASLIATGVEPANESIKVGTGRGRAVVRQRHSVFEIGRQHAALLHERP